MDKISAILYNNEKRSIRSEQEDIMESSEDMDAQNGKIPTDKLLQRLFNIDNIKGFVRCYGNQMKSVPFHEYIRSLCAVIFI